MDSSETMWQLKDGEVVKSYPWLHFGDACPNCASHNCEYRMGNSDRKGCVLVGIDCRDCHQKSQGDQFDTDQPIDFTPVV